jgi:hypothetical protein
MLDSLGFKYEEYGFVTPYGSVRDSSACRLSPASAGSFDRSLHDPEDGGDMFLQKFRFSRKYTTLQTEDRSVHTS